MEWMTAQDITRIFCVGEAKLLRFATRGNLPSRILDGVRVYDRRGVERIFAPRTSPALAERSTPHFGTLGAVELGKSADAENTRVSRLPAPARPREEDEIPFASAV